MIKLFHGNLLQAPAQALVNTVNTQGVMGKGIALQFKQAYPQMFRAYEAACANREVKLGRMHVFDLGGLDGGPRWIINFPTKGHWRARSRVSDIEAGLRDLRRLVGELGIESIAVPPLGCGHGGLDWAEIRPLIERELSEMTDVEVLLYAPAGAPKPIAMPNRTQRPNMTLGQAVVLALMNRYLTALLDPWVTLLELHKLLYFTQEAGVDLRLQYDANIYGPYAKNLRQLLIRMESHYVSGYGDGEDAPKKPLELLPGAYEAARIFLLDKHDVQDRMAKAIKLMEGYEDPFGLELLSSVHWIMRSAPGAADDPQLAVQAVHNWNKRKRQLFKPEHIRKAWQRIRDRCWEEELTV